MRHAQMSLCLELVFIVAVSKVKSDTLVLAYLRILSDIKKMLKVYYLPFCIKRGLGRVIFTSRGARQRYKKYGIGQYSCISFQLMGLYQDTSHLKNVFISAPTSIYKMLNQKQTW